MACCIGDFLSSLKAINPDDRHSLLQACHSQGLEAAVDLAFLDDGDIESLGVPLQVAEIARDAARVLRDGWAVGAARAFSVSLAASQPAPRGGASSQLDLSVAPASKSSRTHKALAAYTRARLAPIRKTVVAKGAKAKGCLMDIEKARMDKAVKRIHAIFVKYAATSSRISAVLNGGDLELGLQLVVYRRGSRSAVAVARRASQIEAFFLDMQVFKWDCSSLTAFQCATWVRTRTSGGTKTAGKVARQVLIWVSDATTFNLFVNDPLVLSQVNSHACTDGVEEPAKVAKTYTIEMMKRFEDLVFIAETVQQRCYAGFFTLLGAVSARAADAQRSRTLYLSNDALIGECRMKNKKTWTRWFCDRRGLNDKGWANSWIVGLNESNLPGPDYILNATSAHMDGWLDRPAEYADLRRSLHLLLMVYFGLSPEQAAEYNPHGFRHVMVGAGQQLRSLGQYQKEDIGRLGKWSEGSEMPERYDNASGVSELNARVKIMAVLRAGWRPAADGELPKPVPAEASSRSLELLVPVGNAKGKKIHRHWTGSRSTKCGRWHCGVADDPDEHAVFDDIPEEWTKCSTCWASLGTRTAALGERVPMHK